MSTDYVYPTPRSPVRDHAMAILQCVTKDGNSYERDPDRPCFGLMEPCELAVFVEAITDETRLTSLGCGALALRAIVAALPSAAILAIA